MGEIGMPALGSRPALLASLRDEGCVRFDAAGWHYLDTLERRAAGYEGSVRRMLEDKLALAVAAYTERFTQARAVASELLATACKQYPDAAAALQRLFSDGDFGGLRRLCATLEAREQCSVFAGLVSRLESGVASAPGLPLAHQAASRAAAAPSPTRELKTVRESRATWARLSVDRQLAQAIKQAPQNAGPINSHMLVVRALALMQDIAPNYLDCMVSYADTLLFLDPGEKEVPVKRKKAPATKAAKSVKAAKK